MTSITLSSLRQRAAEQPVKEIRQVAPKELPLDVPIGKLFAQLPSYPAVNLQSLRQRTERLQEMEISLQSLINCQTQDRICACLAGAVMVGLVASIVLGAIFCPPVAIVSAAILFISGAVCTVLVLDDHLEELPPERREILRSGEVRKVPFRNFPDSSLGPFLKDRTQAELPVQAGGIHNEEDRIVGAMAMTFGGIPGIPLLIFHLLTRKNALQNKVDQLQIEIKDDLLTAGRYLQQHIPAIKEKLNSDITSSKNALERAANCQWPEEIPLANFHKTLNESRALLAELEEKGQPMVDRMAEAGILDSV